MNDCYLCRVLQQFDGVTRPFAEGVFAAVASPTADLFRTFLSVWFAVIGITIFVHPRQGRQVLEGAAVKILIAVIAFGILSNQQILWRYVFEPVQDLSIAFSMNILEYASSMGSSGNLLSPPGNVTSAYAKLFGMAEKQLFMISQTAYNYLEKLSIMSTGFIAAAITGFVLWFLFGLVLLVFGFFMVEAQFYFLAVGALSPLLIVAAFFDATRKYTMAGVSMIALAGVSILTAALAMGFTVAVIHVFANDFACSIDLGPPACQLAAGDQKPDKLETLSVMLLIGFISLLLHIKSKTIASAFSGVQDSAAPATLVAMGAKMASLGTIGTAMQLFGANAAKGAYQQFVSKGGLAKVGADATAAGFRELSGAAKRFLRRG